VKVNSNGIQKSKWNIWNYVKNGGLIVFILAMVVLSGCLQQDNPKSSINNPQTVTPQVKATTISNVVPAITPQAIATDTPQAMTDIKPSVALEKLLITQADVPEFRQNQIGFVATIITNRYSKNLKSPKYVAALPAGTGSIGQMSKWTREKESITATILRFDDGSSFDLSNKIKYCEERNAPCASAGIGDISYYSEMPNTYSKTPYDAPLQTTTLQYIKGENYVTIVVVTEDQKKSHDKAFEIANLVLGRLD